jgi:hypothetical protein
MWVVWPFIIDQRLVQLTPQMFPSHRSQSWISGGDHFLIKIHRCYPSVLLKMVVHVIFKKIGVVWLLINDERLVHLTPHMFTCHISHSWISIVYHFLAKNCRCYPSVLLKMVVHAIFNKNRGCVAFNHRPKARTPHPTYVLLP